MNKVWQIGRIASEIESRTTQSGVSVCTFRIAVNRRFKNAAGQREADFFTVVCWRQTAEFVSRYFAKGSAISVEGSLQSRSYDAQDGSKRYVTEIIAENVEFVGSRENTAQQEPTLEQAGFAEVDDNELPF